MALLGRWVWRLLEGGNDLWARVICSKYCDFWDNVETKKNGGKALGHWSSWWRDLVSVVGMSDWFAKKCRKVIGNGGKPRFWEDRWGGFESKLKDLFPRLYRLETKKDCLVKERM